MKALLGALWAAALLLGTAQSLQCYTCSSASDTASCNTVTNCTAGQDAYCKKVNKDPYSASDYSYSENYYYRIRRYLGDSSTAGRAVSSSVSKSCEATCEESTCFNGAKDVQTSVHCCSTDLCNGVTSVQISSVLLSLAAVASGVLLKAGS